MNKQITLLCACLGLALVLAGPSLHAQPSDVANPQLTELRAKAEKGDAKAQYALGSCYIEGQGVAPDRVEGVKWLRKAAQQNDDKAQVALAIRYANGQGLPKDDVEAYKWILLAAAQNNENAKQNKPNLEALLSPEQIAEGKQRASDWLEQHQTASAGKSANP